MKIYNLLLVAFIAMLMPCILHASTAYYVDCSAATNGNGTYGSPWNSIEAVNNNTFADGDDVYFKVNTTCTLSADSYRLRIRWGGTAGDRAVVGCYDGNGDFDCGATRWADGNRAVISGNNHQYPNIDYRYAIEIYAPYNYITVQEFKIIELGGGHTGQHGIGAFGVMGADYINIDNNYVWRGGTGAIIIGRNGADGSQYCNVTNNYLEYIGYPDYPGSGAVIEVTGVNSAATDYNTISYNYVANSKHEGIGVYNTADHNIVEYNVVRDIRSFHIYLSNSRNNTARYNLVYESTDDLGWGQSEFALAQGPEGWTERYGSPSVMEERIGDHEWYGNVVVGMKHGMNVGCELALVRNSNCTGNNTPWNCCTGNGTGTCADYSNINCYKDTKIYNNTFVDNIYNIYFWNPSSSGAIEVKNNLSYLITSGFVHIGGPSGDSPAGVTWSDNLWYGNGAVGGNAATNAETGNPQLSNPQARGSIAPDSISFDDFKLLDTGSAAHNEGIDLGNSPYNTDYWGTNRDNNSPWDIGAHEYVDVDTTPPAKPTGLEIID